MRRRTPILAGATLLMLVAGGAFAATELQLDLNAIEAQSANAAGMDAAFGGLDHTGSIMLSSGVDTELAGLLIDGVPQGVTLGRLSNLTGQIDFVSGNVTGGDLTVTLDDGETFNADIQNGVGSIQFQAGEGFSIDGLLSSTTFSSDMFAGVDISRWFDAQPLPGSFITFAFDPDSTGFSSNTSTDVFIIVPSPLAGGMAGLGLFGLAVRRRRA